jgi:hypothetical protein
MPSDCKTDADCGEGLLCASYRQGCGPSGFACQTANDECNGDLDCGGAVCAFGVDSLAPDRRSCDGTVCGRPFVVEASARTAPVVSTRDWCANGRAPLMDGWTTEQRAAHAEHWARMGQMEHASIAAFARFQLQLLALGAPVGLVEACTSALHDETQHTKLCFDIASAYAGRRIGPGALEISGSLDVTSLAHVVDLVILEGCYGETGAALEALEAAALATDPVIAAAYELIARDEQRHAELAFRFIRWALDRNPQLVAPRLTQALLEQRGASAQVADIVESCFRAALGQRAAA